MKKHRKELPACIIVTVIAIIVTGLGFANFSFFKKSEPPVRPTPRTLEYVLVPEEPIVLPALPNGNEFEQQPRRMWKKVTRVRGGESEDD